MLVGHLLAKLLLVPHKLAYSLSLLQAMMLPTLQTTCQLQLLDRAPSVQQMSTMQSLHGAIGDPSLQYLLRG